MEVHLYAWIITVVVMVSILVIDVLIIGRRPHEPSMKEASLFIGIYVTRRCSSASGSGPLPVRGTPASSLPAGSPSTASRSTTCSSSDHPDEAEGSRHCSSSH